MTLKRIIFTVSTAYLVCFSIPLSSASNYCTSVSKTTFIGNELTFSQSDIFAHSLNEKGIDGIILCAVPDPKIGVLKFGTRDLLPGEAITSEGISAIKFIPSSSLLGNASFSCIPVYKDGKTHPAITVNINVLKEKNHIPIARDINIKTAKNIAINGVFSGSDPENDILTYSITQQPKHGQAEVCIDSPHKFIYTPFQNKTGKDNFKYVAIDKHGNTSAPATVTIEISRSKLKMTYADMHGNGMHYHASKLAENGIFTGETIGNQHFLHPERKITRSEFIAMAMALKGDYELASAVCETGFADDSAIPAWAKPYVTAASDAGIVNGSSTDGKAYLRPQDIITRGEAAVILNNIIAPTNTMTTVFSDSESIPDWSKQASANICSLSVMGNFHDHTMRPSQQLTRLDAVEILYNAMCILK